MAVYHGRSTRHRKRKRRCLRGRRPIETTIGAEERRSRRVMGGNKKVGLLKAKYVNLSSKGEAVRCEVLELLETPANPEFARKGKITKGAVLLVRTPAGEKVKVRVTSRPGQHGILNAVPLEG